MIGRSLRALPALVRVGFVESLAYRTEMIIWVFSTTMPLVMMTLWTAVARSVPVVGGGGKSWGTTAFVSYFLSVFIVRQLISGWAGWEMYYEVRQGTLAMRLLRPIHPLLSYGVGNLAALPLRAAVTLPVIVVLFATNARDHLSHDWHVWLLFPFALVGGWVITFFANVAIGALSLFMESSVKLMDVWLAAFFVFSGYLFPLDLFPDWLTAAAKWLPFRYQIGLPVELMTGVHTWESALPLLAKQWAWAAALIVASLAIWNRGLARFQAFGG
ncbi:MAG: ABC transporter permease [Archangiaceae bacterium]|nr:ABC transporter permease [Archangiaceae bacterium]